MTMIPHAPARAIPLALLALALVATSGCGWFRGKSIYEDAPEARPLEVPPDLDAPRIDPAMTIPSVAAPAAVPARQPAGADGSPFVVADGPESVYRRLGLALERIDGVEVLERARLLSAYNVRYQGETFLVRVSAEGDGSRVSATGQDGRDLGSAEATRLLGLLRQRLG
jgi:uncharacterized lipoprotein